MILPKPWTSARFQIDLKKDGKYTIENYLPFVVRHNGTWKVDDIYYPFRLYFTEDGATEQAKYRYPIPHYQWRT
ncbi:DUF5004 domain-containing protein [Bacteroides xylanisolvens]|nr:DUF5004 domain-containing protein [Bacteroides xylanisolvens]